jgi:flagellar biosynthesis regulator FlbT
VRKVEEEVAAGQLYQALKSTRQLIAKEQEILNGFTGTEIRQSATAG